MSSGVLRSMFSLPWFQPSDFAGEFEAQPRPDPSWRAAAAVFIGGGCRARTSGNPENGGLDVFGVELRVFFVK